MRKFRIGNVFKLYNRIHIVSNNRSLNDGELTDWISFDSSNVSGVTRDKTKTEKSMCWDCDTNDSEYPDYECKTCKGTGYYMKEIKGMDQAIYLADNVKEYIIKRLLANFDF